jgi:hypothetical protein
LGRGCDGCIDDTGGDGDDGDDGDDEGSDSMLLALGCSWRVHLREAGGVKSESVVDRRLGVLSAAGSDR